MTTRDFLQQMDARIEKYDLLCHPFYKAWAAGETSITVHCQFTDSQGKVLLERDI